jgi:hypothetical protein
MKTLPVRVVVGLVALLLGEPAQVPAASVVITFEGVEDTLFTAPITRLQFEIGNPPLEVQHFRELDSATHSREVPDNGTGVLYNERDTHIFLHAEPGAPFQTFRLSSVDVASGISSTSASATIEGFLDGVSTGILRIPVSQLDYISVNGESLGMIDEARWKGFGEGGGGFVLDNIALETFPAAVPGLWPLVSLGIGALGGLAYPGSWWRGAARPRGPRGPASLKPGRSSTFRSSSTM